jgi:hypothetical protein
MFRSGAFFAPDRINAGSGGPTILESPEATTDRQHPQGLIFGSPVAYCGKVGPVRKLTKEQKRDIAAKNDRDIDFSDIPPVRGWSGAEVGKFYRPAKKPGNGQRKAHKPFTKDDEGRR